jgi:hypothetical protein
VKIVMLIGLPGSGKTYKAETEYVPKGYALIDDPTDVGLVREIIQGCLMTDQNVVITDPHLCNAWHRADAIATIEKWVPDTVQVECVYFENDPLKASANVTHRKDGRGTFDMGVLSKGYYIPDGVKTLPIWEPPVTVDVD